jgi:hypothetical protein
MQVPITIADPSLYTSSELELEAGELNPGSIKVEKEIYTSEI